MMKIQIIALVCRKLHRECRNRALAVGFGSHAAEAFGAFGSRGRLASSDHTRDGLQIGDEANVVPAVFVLAFKKLNDGGRDRTADFKNEPSAGAKSGASLGNQAGDDFDASGAGENGAARFELADFELDLIFFRLPDVGRIGNDEVESSQVESGEQVGAMEVDAILELMAGCVGAGDFESGFGNVGGVNYSLRKLFG